MERVVVERVFSEPVDVPALVERYRKGESCFASRRIVSLRSVVSRDRLRMICEYAAPDAESVRMANQLAGLPFERVWTAEVLAESPSAEGVER